jgi:homocysteine S-methyltransferase
MKDFRELLDNDRIYVFDGAVGTRLYDKGIYINRSYDELLIAPTLSRGARVRKGRCQIIETNSSGAPAKASDLRA